MRKIFYLGFLVNLFGLSAFADITKTVDETTGLSAWVLKDNGLELTLKQAYPEQIRAFYLARGFPDKIAGEIANSCMFQTIAKNTLNKSDKNAATITLEQALWKVKTRSQTKGIKLKKIWDSQWQKQQLKPSARIAYRWATFPTQQSFEPSGDYNWGMTCFDLKPGTEFDVEISWKHGKIKKSAWMYSLSCATNTPQRSATN